MRKSELESMVDDHKRQIAKLGSQVMDLYQNLAAMAKCLNLEFVPEKTIELKYEKIAVKDVCVEGKKGRVKKPGDTYPETCLFIGLENGSFLHKESDLKAFLKKREKTGG